MIEGGVVVVRETICLCDSDLLYGRMIIKALQEEVVLPVVYAYFSGLEAFYNYLEDNKVALLLLEKEKEEEFYTGLKGRGLQDDEIKQWKEKVLLLSKEQETYEHELYKYLPRQVLVAWLKDWWEARFGKSKEIKRVEYLNHAGKKIITGYITFGGVRLERYLEVVQQKGIPSLVLNLELFAYTKPHEKPKKNMSDLIYLASINRLSKANIKDFLYSVESVDYVEPLAHYGDGYELSEQVVTVLIDYLRELPYIRIYIITDCRYRGAAKLLELCDDVELEEPDNTIERYKNKLILQMLHLEEREELLKKLEPVKKEEVYG